MKRIALLLVIIISLTGCATSSSGLNTATMETETLVSYPAGVSETYLSRAMSPPPAMYNTTAEENKLDGTICVLQGSVTEHGGETDGGLPYDYFVLDTDAGAVAVFDIYNYTKAFDPENFYFFEEPDIDYTFPPIGETVNVYAVYHGYSDALDLPAFYYGVTKIDAVVYGFYDTESIIVDQEQTQEPYYTKDPGISLDNEQKAIAPPTESVTLGQKNALSSAKKYLALMPFSRSGLIDQLEYEGFSTDEATYAVDNCNADWNEQAAKKAKQYLDLMSFSRQGLIDQLKYDGFTSTQAEYGVSAAGY